MILAYHNDKWQHRPTTKINTLDYNDPFPIAKLYGFNFPIPVVQHHNKSGYNLAYEKAYLVEVPDIRLYNTIFGNYILKKSKPNLNNL